MQQLMQAIQAEQAKCPIHPPGRAPDVTSTPSLQQQERQANKGATECWESDISDSLIHFLISDSRSVYDLIFTLSILLTIIR